MINIQWTKFEQKSIVNYFGGITLKAISEENTILSITSRRKNIFWIFFFKRTKSKIYLAIVKYFFPKMVTFGVGCYLKRPSRLGQYQSRTSVKINFL